ncbi:TrmH family RNA methyltransferase [Bifidobacterium avesanii]|uniref:RNA methyltransferase n=1 Tax=Bifidobacterium avesanii TaxID=1798157 RepID=A0A7K3TG13_9BIFI|nr:RNA methyltransferase [Bifidobacterium avesanii]KAB8295566.1 rRNA methyltransferase [Bifidobacterium avesanii]NEG77570.1 RNA methyltransferase [Bifidobacterium avesanii]
MPINSRVIDNPKSDRVKRVAGLASHKTRERVGRFLIEGPQSVREAVRWRPDVVQDLYVQEDASPAVRGIEEESQDSTIYVHHVTAEVMARISKDAQGIVAVGNAAAMDVSPESLEIGPGALVAAFWQVRDPGNAGTVIRAADAAGCAAVILVDDCVDRLNPKTIRSTAGSLFHIPVLTMGTDEFFAFAAARKMPVWAADVYGVPGREPEALPDVLANLGKDGQGKGGKDERAPKAVLFGNEARGLEPAELERCERIVSIPIYGKAESLNLGTSAAVMLMSLAMSSHAGTIWAV